MCTNNYMSAVQLAEMHGRHVIKLYYILFVHFVLRNFHAGGLTCRIIYMAGVEETFILVISFLQLSFRLNDLNSTIYPFMLG